MLRAGHRIQDRIAQTAEIVFSHDRLKWWKQMAAAIRVAPGDLDAYMHHAWDAERAAEIDRFLAGMLMCHAAKLDSDRRLAEILLLADQYMSLHRHRPLLPEGHARGRAIEEAIDAPPSGDLAWMPAELRAQAAELLEDD
jgi:hypothetical protein